MVAVDEPLVELETDKVTIEVPAPAAGVLTDLAAKDGDTVAVGALLGAIKEGAGAAPAARPKDRKSEAASRSATTAPEKPAAPKRPPRQPNSARAVGAQDRRRDRHRRSCRSRHRQGRPHHQGRHARRYRARRGEPTPVRRRPVSSARPARPTTPRAKSGCA